MDIPPVLCNKILRVFGPQGQKWLGQLPQLYRRCVEKWHLSNCRLSPVISYNLVCFAKSPQFGPVVLKIGMPVRELYTEIEALTLYRGRQICNIYAADTELGAFLVEPLVPGYDLTTLNSSSERIVVAAELIPRLPVAAGSSSELPTFAQLLNAACIRFRSENGGEARMRQFTEHAEFLFAELNQRPQVLLHGDMNHWNILRAGERWKAIDPKGMLGPGCLEAGRFITNELNMVDASARLDCLREAVTALGAGFDENPKTIALCTFIDKVISTCWFFEEVVDRDRSKHVTQCELLWDFYCGL
ncbi:MAG: hypothetical protein FH749_08305 [Firmicutes bacterium]|nr:hypothetical protein [Bacillota bacterium]